MGVNLIQEPSLSSNEEFNFTAFFNSSQQMSGSFSHRELFEDYTYNQSGQVHIPDRLGILLEMKRDD